MYTDRQALHEEENLEGEGHELLYLYIPVTRKPWDYLQIRTVPRFLYFLLSF